jgi:phage gp29-like protein
VSILDQFGRSIPASEIRRLRDEVAAPTLAGVRPVWSGHPAEGLTPRRLAAIHRAAAQGDALRYLELAEDIEERDLHYAAVIGTRKRAVAQLPIAVEAASDDAEHVRHADFLRDWLTSGCLEEALPDILDAVGKGFSVLEVMWRTDPGAFVPERLVYRPQRWFDVSQDNGDTIMLREGATLQELASHKFMVHRHPSKSGLIMRSGLARVASWAWMFKSFTLRDWAIFVQNYGQPLRLGRYGPESSAEDRRVLWQAVANIAGDCAAIVPKGMEVEFIEVKAAADGSALYEKRADWLDRQISKLVLGQTTTTDAVSGGHAVAKEHRLVQEDIERADARMLSMSVTRQLGQAIIAFNFGPQAKYPVIRIGRPDEVPLTEVVDAIHKLGPMGLTVEASQVRDRLGLAEPAKGEDVEVIGGRPPPPPPPPAADEEPKPPAGPPELQAFRRRIASLHASQPEADVMQALTDRLALDAQGALGGVLDRVQAELHAATDLADFGRRLASLDLDPTALAEVLGRGMAIAHLAGQAAVLDELQGG